jgi:hypothetical protein
LALGPVLGRAYEHLDHVVVQTVVELALKFPLELRMIKVPGMKFEVVGMDRDCWLFEVDDYFHPFTFGPGREIQQRVLVEFQLSQNTFEPQICIIGHLMILTGVSVCVERAPPPAAL